MYFSPSVLESLVFDVASAISLPSESLGNLLCHLRFPGIEVPRCFAEVVADRSKLSTEPKMLPQRIAYGVIESGLGHFDLTERYEEQVRLCKQIERVSLELKRRNHPVLLIAEFERNLSILLLASSAARDLGCEERDVLSTELAALVEQLIIAVEAQRELSALLLRRIISLLRREQTLRLRERVEAAVTEGLKNSKTLDAESELFDLSEPLRFRMTLIERPSFCESAWETKRLVSELCR